MKYWNTLCGIVLLVGLVGCQAQPSLALTPLRVQLSWTPEYSSAFLYTAAKNGHFTANGLDVDLITGGFNADGYINPIDEVLQGRADIAMSDGMSILQARAAGDPVLAVASALQRSPLAVLSLPESRIDVPGDLVGKTVAVSDGGATTVFLALLQAEGIDPASVNIVPRTSFGVEQLTSGQVDGLVGWIINEGITLREAAYDPVVLLMNNYRVATYDFVIFTSEDFAAQHSETVEAFLSALLAGLDDVLANPTQSVTDLLEINPILDPVAQERRLIATLPLMSVPGQDPLSMDFRVWDFTHATLLNQDLLPAPLDLYSVYTLDFLPSAS